MKGRRRVGLTLVALLAGCTTSAEPTTTTTTAVVDTVPDPATTITNAPSEPSPVDICEDRTSWESNTTHIASCFVVPLTFTPNTDGWRSPKSDLEWIEGIWVEPGERDPAIRFVVLAHMIDATPAEAIDSILSIEGVDATTEQNDDGTGLRVDVETAPTERGRVDGSRPECAQTSRLDLIQSFTEPGYVLLDGLSLTGTWGGQYGLGACRNFRIWAIPIGDITVTVVATTDDLDRFDELMPMMDELVSTIQAATP